MIRSPTNYDLPAKSYPRSQQGLTNTSESYPLFGKSTSTLSLNIPFQAGYPDFLSSPTTNRYTVLIRQKPFRYCRSSGMTPDLCRNIQFFGQPRIDAVLPGLRSIPDVFWREWSEWSKSILPPQILDILHRRLPHQIQSKNQPWTSDGKKADGNARWKTTTWQSDTGQESTVDIGREKGRWEHQLKDNYLTIRHWTRINRGHRPEKRPMATRTNQIKISLWELNMVMVENANQPTFPVEPQKQGIGAKKQSVIGLNIWKKLPGV